MSKKIGKFLTHLRKSRGVSLEKAAKAFFLSQEEIMCYESGEKEPNMNVWSAYAITYNVPYNAFKLTLSSRQMHRSSPCDKEGYEYES